MRLYKQTIQDFTLFAGRELEDKEYAALLDAAGKMSAKMRAIRIVSAASVSKGDLQQRLIRKGENAEDARQAVDWMTEMDLLDDGRTAQQIVSRCAAKGYGINRAKQALYEKRIPKHHWDEALADYPDQSEAILSFLQNRIGTEQDPKEVKRAIEALLRRGHNYSEIRRGLQQMACTDEFLED